MPKATNQIQDTQKTALGRVGSTALNAELQTSYHEKQIVPRLRT